MSKRVLVAFDVSDEQARDEADLVLSVQARLQDEAGYLGVDGEEPLLPVGPVHVAVVDDDGHITSELLLGAYCVGFER